MLIFKSINNLKIHKKQSNFFKKYIIKPFKSLIKIFYTKIKMSSNKSSLKVGFWPF